MIGVFINARLGSIRLKNKHLIEVNKKPFIIWLIERFSIKFQNKITKKELKNIRSFSLIFLKYLRRLGM